MPLMANPKGRYCAIFFTVHYTAPGGIGQVLFLDLQGFSDFPVVK